MEARTILVHLNVELDRRDERSAEDVEEALRAALDVGLEGGDANLHPSQVTFAMAEEI